VPPAELPRALSGNGRIANKNTETIEHTLRQRAALKLHFAVAERGLWNWRNEMLETIAIILIVLWLLGMVSGYTLGNFIYVLLVIAIVLFLVRLVSGRRVV
jgi:hypothetical protein